MRTDMESLDLQRAAAYLVTKERLDARKTGGKLRCQAPNRACGERCIPPEWACRLKGEGDDGHLLAVGKGSDPVGGLANIERGFTRARKGLISLSFSELEGARRSISRGAAKLSPGDLKAKQEVKETTEKFINYVAVPLAAFVGAALLHKGLKNFKGYREGYGASVDSAAKSVFDGVRQNIPVYGPQVQQRQRVGVEAVSALGRVGQSINTTGPGTRQNLSRTATKIPTQVADELDKTLQRVSTIKARNGSKPSKEAYEVWEQKAYSEFWSTPRPDAQSPVDANKGSIFSVQATNDLMSRSFGLPKPANVNLKSEGKEIILNIAQVFKKTGGSIKTSMKEAGLDYRDPQQVRQYIGRASKNTNQVDDNTTKLLVDTVTGTDYQTQAGTFYKKTLSGYDQLFKKVSEDVVRPPNINENVGMGTAAARRRNIEDLRRSSYYNDAVLAQSQYLANNAELTAPVYGPFTGLIARRTYYARNVAGPRTLRDNNEVTLNLTSSQVYNAGIEVAAKTGQPEPKTIDDALRLVTRTYGGDQSEFGGSSIGRINSVNGSVSSTWNGTRVERTGPAPKASASAPKAAGTGQPRSATRKPRSRSQIISDLLKQKGKGSNYTPESAAAEADRIIGLRRQDARADSYLLTRQDYTEPGDRKGKPCGKSFVPKDTKCSKPGMARYADPEVNQAKSGPAKPLETAAKVAAVAGAVAGTVLAAKKGKALFQNRRSSRVYTNTVNMGLAKAVRRLSQDDIRKGLQKVPARFRPQAENLVGKAKSALVYVQADAQGFDLKKVNNKGNFSVFKNEKDGKVLTVGSVGDTLVMFNADRKSNIDIRTETGRGVGVYEVQFTTDASYSQKQGLSKESQSGIGTMLKAMNKDTIENLPPNALLRNTPFGDDGLGRKRAAIYKRFGYKPIQGVRGNTMFATLSNGKVTPIEAKYEGFYAELIKGKSYEEAAKAFSRGDVADIRAQAYITTKEKLEAAFAPKSEKGSNPMLTPELVWT